MYIYSSSISCGVSQAWDLSRQPVECIKDYVKNCEQRKQAFIIFSDKAIGKGDSYGSGPKLADYIRQNDLGEVLETPEQYNPNSRNMIKVWVWTPNTDKCFNHVKGLSK